MLQRMREQKDSIFITVLFGIIIIVFIFMFGLPGVDSCRSKGQGQLGHVRSHEITGDLTRSMIYRYYDDNVFSSKNYAGTARQVAYGVGVVYLLADEARKAGLRVSDDELHYYITDWESGNSDILQLKFIQHSKFNKRNYERALSRIMISSHDYENYKREELLAKRYMELLASSIHVSEESLWQEFVRYSAEANIEMIKLTADDINATLPEITGDDVLAFVSEHEADIQQYYDAHLNEFTTPAMAKLQKIRIQKGFGELTSPGEKTIKTYQPNQRFAVARAQILENAADFDQAFVDYDESQNKSEHGVEALKPISGNSAELQAAMKDKKVGDIVTAEESDVFVIAKILELTDAIVTPLEEAKFGIAAKMLGDNRVNEKMDAVSSGIIALVQSGKSMQEAVDEALYTGVLDSEPEVPAADDSDEPADDADSAAAHADDADADADADDSDDDDAAEETPAIPVVVPEKRVKPKMLNDVSVSSTFIAGMGTSEDLARDIRGAQDGTLLAKPYKIGMDTYIARVVSHKAPDRAVFDVAKDNLRAKAIADKRLALVGDPQKVVELTGPYGLWVQQKIDLAIKNNQFSLNEDYFARENKRRAEKE